MTTRHRLTDDTRARVAHTFATFTESAQRMSRHIAHEYARRHDAAAAHTLGTVHGRAARRAAEGHSRRVVLLAHTVDALRTSGRDFTADTVALAFRGDVESVNLVHDAAADGHGWALAVVAALRLTDHTDATSWTVPLTDDEDTATATVAALTHADDTPPPKPRATLTGSVDVCAPPARTLPSRSVQASGSRPREDIAQT